ncbi:MAG: dTDP-4-keto-6-deoxy-D-glucose epimerase, partial [Methylocystaceae bacterium]|nr:dTDP-4-keto-6-deoxy-D-glucose epimerase [Methylocystaceae bacterium]
MHYQRDPKAEVKLVTCISGEIYDVAVDLRENSPTYLKYFGIELTEKNGLQLYIPKGFAHGYQTLVDDSTVFYMVSQKYSPGYESGLFYDDSAL